MTDNITAVYAVSWRSRGGVLRLSYSLQRRIVKTIVRYTGTFHVTVQCMLHDGIEGVHGNVIPVNTAAGVKVVVIKRKFLLLFRMQDLRELLQRHFADPS